MLTVTLAQAPQAGAGLKGIVVRVHDGDTMTILTPDKTEVKIRLLGIDAPETGQPYGSAAKKSLSSLVFGREAHLHATGIDKYGRTLGQLHVGDIWVNHEQILRGMAWHYLQYSQDAELAQAEAEARRARRGLWQENKPVPPWLWRRQPHKKNG
ncbi:thermonuclease family protein [Verrucomicrobium sp. BvORR106]|uniref:thermonuclease family protein n=1 Tax=Verrucomicrobium sp. BvORR106 TaxID=1403819 RepID=UPI0007C7AFBD|nr:thermonuclease family protein [Verrucomicrobium sp. BvORR106]